MLVDLHGNPVAGTSRNEYVKMTRRLCSASLFDFVKIFWGGVESQPYIDNWHIEAICEHLQAVTEGKIKRLLINIPPGCSKSLLTCVFWPMWEWARSPYIRWFFASYDQRLSTRDSVKCRALFHSELYQECWGNCYCITRDQNQKTYYETSRGGYRLATSIGGHGTGQHPDRIVVDDPHNAQQAESELERQSCRDWWDLTMSTRGVSRNASRVIIMQRLEENDLAGHVLKKGNYEHLCLCMRHEFDRMPPTSLGWMDPRLREGELLTPRQFPEEVVVEMEKNLGAYGVAGQLQQRPRPKSGGMFKFHYFNQRVKAAPYEAERIRFYDRASTADGGCYSAGVLMAKDKSGDYYVEDMVHGQWEPTERNAIMRATALKDRARYGPNHEPVIYVEMEGGSSGRDAWKGVAKALEGFRVIEQQVTGKKDVRAEPWSAQLAALNVYLVDNGESKGTGKATWDINAFVQEHLLFRPDPFTKRLGKFKDQVDSCSGAYNLFVARRSSDPLRVVSIGKKVGKGIRLIVCTREELATLVVEDQRCILVSIRDPLGTPELPLHGVHKLLGSLCLQFIDTSPSERQETWGEDVVPYSKPASELIFTTEQAKRIWGMLLKNEKNLELVILQDDGDRRAVSLACGIADVLRQERKSCITFPANLDTVLADKSLNQHVIDVVKNARGMVSS